MNWFRSLSDLGNTYSEGETKLFIELQNRGHTRNMLTHVHVSLDKELDGVGDCEVDNMWDFYAVFLDGTGVHKSEHRWKIDGLIKKGLERKGFVVDRFRYKSPMSNRRCREIADAIEERLMKL